MILVRRVMIYGIILFTHNIHIKKLKLFELEMEIGLIKVLKI